MFGYIDTADDGSMTFDVYDNYAEAYFVDPAEREYSAYDVSRMTDEEYYAMSDAEYKDYLRGVEAEYYNL